MKFSIIFLALALTLTSQARAFDRNFLTRVWDVSCKGAGHSVYIQYDTGFSAYGPKEFLIDQQSAASGMQMLFEGNSTTYQTKKFKMTIDPSKVANNKPFSGAALIGGQKVPLTCTKTDKFKFFQPKEDVEIEQPSQSSPAKSSGKTAN